MTLLPIYIFGALSNALISSINGRKQREFQKELTEENREFQYKSQLEAQLRSFALTNTWPLDTSPVDIADMLIGMTNVPLFLVVAPVQQSGIQKELYSIWEELHSFFLNEFPINSQTPVVHGGYKTNWPVSRSQDVMKIFAGIREIPTLYIAPYSTARDSVLGVTIAFWGFGGECQPTVQNFELDVRKLYIDEIRRDAKDYKDRCNDGRLTWDDKSAMASNCKLFEEEIKLLHQGNDFHYLDQKLNFYKTLRPSQATYNSMAGQILPVVQLFSSAIVDAYFVVQCGTRPVFPNVASRILEQNRLPELLSKGIANSTGDFGLMQGSDFAEALGESYARVVADNVDVEVFRKYHDQFDLLPDSGRKVFESVMQAREKRVAQLEDLSQRAIKGNDPSAQFQIALYWLKRKDYEECLKWAGLSADNGNADAVLLKNELLKAIKYSCS